MQSVQTGHIFPLTSVKPLEGLFAYRQYCFEAVQKALASSSAVKRRQSPIDGTPLEFWARIGDLEYWRCPKTGSLFLGSLPDLKVWGALLEEVNKYRQAKGFHKDIKKLRLENVYLPKITWIENGLRLQGLKKTNALEVAASESEFAPLLKEKGVFQEVKVLSEMDLFFKEGNECSVGAGVLLESLDRAVHPDKLLTNIHRCLHSGGLLFITSLVSSGFDALVLGKENAYLYPPDRTNFFSLLGLKELVKRAGFELLEISTPGVLDVEVVQTHMIHGVKPVLSAFEKELMASNDDIRRHFQKFLQQANMSSFARIMARKG